MKFQYQISLLKSRYNSLKKYESNYLRFIMKLKAQKVYF
jgi:hypothetical protein